VNPSCRIGIFGGSFDPVHLGHVKLAEKAFKLKSLQRIYFIPVKRSPFKSLGPQASAQDRLSMLRLALGKNPVFKISSCELRRSAPSYTIHTVRFFRKKFPRAELFLLMAADAMKHFGKWKNSVEIRKECRFLSSKRIGRISSRDIRSRAAFGQSLKGWVPGKVESYILRKGLYGA